MTAQLIETLNCLNGLLFRLDNKTGDSRVDDFGTDPARDSI